MGPSLATAPCAGLGEGRGPHPPGALLGSGPRGREESPPPPFAGGSVFGLLVTGPGEAWLLVLGVASLLCRAKGYY